MTEDPKAIKALFAEWEVDYALRAAGDLTSDPKRLNEVMAQIERLKQGTRPAVVGRDGEYRIEDRPWKDVAEPSKLAVLQDLDWSGITNRDKGHILLSVIDPGKITDAQRRNLIDLATEKPREQSREGRDEGHER